MSELMARPREAMRGVRDTDPLARRLPAKVQRAVDRESAWGLVGAARAQAAGYVAEARIEAAELATEVGLLCLDRLQRVETATGRADPIRAERAAGLVEEYLLVARSEVHQLRRNF